MPSGAPVHPNGYVGGVFPVGRPEGVFGGFPGGVLQLLGGVAAPLLARPHVVTTVHASMGMGSHQYDVSART